MTDCSRKGQRWKWVAEDRENVHMWCLEMVLFSNSQWRHPLFGCCQLPHSICWAFTELFITLYVIINVLTNAVFYIAALWPWPCRWREPSFLELKNNLLSTDNAKLFCQFLDRLCTLVTPVKLFVLTTIDLCHFFVFQCLFIWSPSSAFHLALSVTFFLIIFLSFSCCHLATLLSAPHDIFQLALVFLTQQYSTLQVNCPARSHYLE